MTNYPRVKQDEFRIENRAKRAVICCFSEDWDSKEETGRDFGRDMIMELYEEGEATNQKLALQIKGRSNLKLVNQCFSCPIPVKTINYALNDVMPFLLMLFVNETKTVYWVDIKAYMLTVEDEKWMTQETLNIHFPLSQVACSAENEKMIAIAKKGKLTRRSELTRMPSAG